MAKKPGSDSSGTSSKKGIWQKLQELTQSDLQGAEPVEFHPARPLSVQVLKSGFAQRVVFFYPGEEGTYIENPKVTLYENGMVHIQAPGEETTTHLQNCEILWRFETEAEDSEKANKVRLLKIDSKREKSPSQSPDLNE